MLKKTNAKKGEGGGGRAEEVSGNKGKCRKWLNSLDGGNELRGSLRKSFYNLHMRNKMIIGTDKSCWERGLHVRDNGRARGACEGAPREA